MARSRPDEILERALDYPYAVPERSYAYLGGRALELSDDGPKGKGGDLARERIGAEPPAREPLLAYGANAAPAALARKLASLPAVPLPVLRAELIGFDVVYSAHVAPYGAVPATLRESPGTATPVFVLYSTPEQRALLAATEPNYESRRLGGVELRLDAAASRALAPPTPGRAGAELSEVDAFLSRHGCLTLSGEPVALAAIRAAGRAFAELGQAAVLERIRARYAPDLDLEQFVLACVERGGIAPLPALGPL